MYLVGVTGGLREINGVTHSIRPSNGLLSLLNTQDVGNSVGIDLPDELVLPNYTVGNYFYLDGQQITLDRDIIEYWNPLLYMCRRNSLQIVPLQDNEVFHEEAMLERRLEEAQESLSMLEATGHRNRIDISAIGSERCELERDIYRHEREISYVKAVKQQGVRLERMILAEPDVVLIDIDDADYLMNFRERLAKRGVDISSFVVDDVNPDTIGKTQQLVAKLHREPKYDPTVPAQRERLIREYNAAVHGRILTEGMPDFIGTTDSYIPARGLFEITIEKRRGRRFKGFGYDHFGGFDVQGTMDGNRMFFQQVYDKESLELGALPGHIMNYAEKSRDGFSGFWVAKQLMPSGQVMENYGRFQLLPVESLKGD